MYIYIYMIDICYKPTRPTPTRKKEVFLETNEGSRCVGKVRNGGSIYPRPSRCFHLNIHR